MANRLLRYSTSRFRYVTLVLQLGLPGVQPFMILTKGGATCEVADKIFTNLKEAGKEDSLPAAFTLASLAFSKDDIADQE